MALAAGGSLLFCFVLLKGLTAALNVKDPSAARFLLGGDSTTRIRLHRLAEPVASIGQPVTLDQRDAVTSREIAIAALREEPLSFEAFRQLARSAQQGDDPRRAQVFLTEAYRRSYRDPDVALQLLSDSLRRADYPAALNQADGLIRSMPDLLNVLMPIMVAIGDQQTGKWALVELMKRNPPWRQRFLEPLGSSAKNIATFKEIYDASRSSTNPLSRAELREFIYTLIVNNDIDQALSIWYGFLPQEQLHGLKFVYNGRFELPINDVPFNWTIGRDVEASVKVEPISDKSGRNGLRVGFSGRRTEFKHFYQFLALTPGKYKLTGNFKSEDFQHARGLIWRVYCGPSATQLIGQTSNLKDGSHWRRFDTTFEVPSDRCTAQRLQLELDARIPSEQLTSGAAWFDDIAISKQ